MGKGSQKGGYQEHRHKGKGKDRGKDRDDPRLQRDDDIERRYNAPPSATSLNATAFISLALYVHGTIEPIKEQLLKSWNVLFIFRSGFPGFYDMAELCYIQPLYP